MTDIGIIALLLILVNIAFSYKGLKDRDFFEDYKFNVDKILINKEYKRLITSSFLHVNWLHLLFNMVSLYSFAGLLEHHLGSLSFFIIYLCSSLGGDLLALFIHRNHGDYSSVGASGAVFGVTFATIALFPGLNIGLILLPFSIPSWIYGLIYVGISIYGIKSNQDNIGHEAHLGGAIIGMITALIFKPNALLENYLTISVIAIPTLVFIYLILTKPHLLLIDNLFYNSNEKYVTLDEIYNERKLNKQKELDKILDKISEKGYDSLSKNEKLKLDEYSKTLH